MSPFDARLQQLADEAKLRPSHIFHVAHALAESGEAFDPAAFAAFARLEKEHIERAVTALRSSGLLDPQGRFCGTKARRGCTGNNLRAVRGTRLPAVFQEPPEWIAWAQEKRRWSEADARDELARFTDYWHSQPGQKGVKTDWLATWRNWCRNSTRPDGTYVSGQLPPEQSEDRRWIIEERDRLNNSPWNEAGELEWRRRRDAVYAR